MPSRVLFVVGTRPEAIKLAPVIAACRARPAEIKTVVCLSGQHREMIAPVVEYFGLAPDIELDAMRPEQTLAQLTARLLEQLDAALRQARPDCVVVQGDTTTVLAASLAAFYARLPVVHVEAGLRTGDLLSPWPEEMNRAVTSLLTRVHCAPTPRAADNLRAAGVPDSRIHITGNPVVDALLWTVARERKNGARWRDRYAMLGERRMVLITGHRRENFGEGFRQICEAIGTLAARHPDVEFVYPLHLNPQVQIPVRAALGERPNVRLLPPAAYPEFVWLMDRAALILTDSGGVQEEAPSLGKPVLVMRETTERPEGIEAGTAELVGTSPERIVARATALLAAPPRARSSSDSPPINPYGDGRAAERIVELMLRELGG